MTKQIAIVSIPFKIPMEFRVNINKDFEIINISFHGQNVVLSFIVDPTSLITSKDYIFLGPNMTFDDSQFKYVMSNGPAVLLEVKPCVLKLPS